MPGRSEVHSPSPRCTSLRHTASGAAENTTSAVAGITTQSPWAISASSWPGPQPAWPANARTRSRGILPSSVRAKASLLVSMRTSPNTGSESGSSFVLRTRVRRDVGSTGPPRQSRSVRAATPPSSGSSFASLIGVG